MKSGFYRTALTACTRQLLQALTVCTALSACQKIDPNVSRLQHAEGQLVRDDSAAWGDCHALGPTPAALTPMQTTVNAYLRDLATRIMERSNESLTLEGREPVFVGEFAPQKFCFKSPSEVETELNAAAGTSVREISFKPYTFLALPQEAALAAIMCHELAHVTLQHGTSKDIRPDLERAFMSGPGFEERFHQATNLCNSLRASTDLTPQIAEKLFGRDSEAFRIIARNRREFDEYFDLNYFELAYSFLHSKPDTSIFACRLRAEIVGALSSLTAPPEGLARLNPQELFLWNNWLLEKEKIDASATAGEVTPQSALTLLEQLASQLDDAYASGRNALISWKEQEADEVGYEICLRAGVDVTSFAALHRLTLAEKEKTVGSSCLSDVEAGRVPDREMGMHPSACWRTYDIEKREPEKHATYYEGLLARIPLQELLGAERLDQVLNVVRSNR